MGERKEKRPAGCAYIVDSRDGRHYVRRATHFDNLHVYAGGDKFWDLRFIIGKILEDRHHLRMHIARTEAENTGVRAHLARQADEIAELRACVAELAGKAERRELDAWADGLSSES